MARDSFVVVIEDGHRWLTHGGEVTDEWPAAAKLPAGAAMRLAARYQGAESARVARVVVRYSFSFVEGDQ